MLNVTTIVGTRPQLVKAAGLHAALARFPQVRQRLVHTGQHYDDLLSGVFFRELGMAPPDALLEVGSGSHGAMTGRMLEKIEADLLAHRCDVLLVYGDTNSTLAGALAAVKLHVPVAHVEAGLRSFNRRMPEEINRIATDHVSDVLYAPTQTAVEQLAREGIPAERVENVGDVMYDVALEQTRRAEASSEVLPRLGLDSKDFLLATVHRAENTDDPTRLAAIVGGLAAVARSVPVVWPVHPRTRKMLGEQGLDTGPIRTTEPMSFHDSLILEKHARLVATDSGGVQKEAFFHRTPCLTLRTETEWVELVESGWNRLCPLESASQVEQAIREALDAPPGREVSPYGDGRACDRILDSLLRRFAA